MATETKTFYPGAYENASLSRGSITGPTNPVGKGSSNTTRAGISAKSGASYAYWPFDVSVIPQDANIDSVSCKAKASVSSVTNTSASLQLYSGNTAKGSSFTGLNVYDDVRTLSPGTWTRNELNSIRLRTYFNNASSTEKSLYFYGADLTVTYTYQSEKFMLKLSGDYEDVARTFKKVSGIWVEQTELANVIQDGVRYQNGGEIKSTGPTLISFTIDGIGYQAEEGMTWIEFCSSSYNTKGWWCDDYDVMDEDDCFLFLSSSRTSVRPSDTIVSGGSYYVE